MEYLFRVFLLSKYKKWGVVISIYSGLNITNEELVDLYQHGHNDALEALYETNQKLIMRISSKCNVSHVPTIDPEDLNQVGYFALLKAAQKFDASKGYKFVTYLYRYIDGYLKRYIEQHNATKEETSYNKEVTGESGSVGEIVDNLADVEYAYETIELREDVRAAIAVLSDQHKKIIMLHYGIDLDTSISLIEVSELFGLSYQRITQLHREALRILAKTQLLKQYKLLAKKNKIYTRAERKERLSYKSVEIELDELLKECRKVVYKLNP